MPSILCRPIPGYEGLYSVTNDGRVWSEPRITPHGHRWKGRWLKATLGANGRLHVILYHNGSRACPDVNCLVLSAFVGPRPVGLECCHNNGNPTDNRLENLRWDTASANALDAVRHGTSGGLKKKGEANYNAVLTEQRVRQLIYTHKTGLFSQLEIAEQYGVTQSAVSIIVNHKAWKHIWKET